MFVALLYSYSQKLKAVPSLHPLLSNSSIRLASLLSLSFLCTFILVRICEAFSSLS